MRAIIISEFVGLMFQTTIYGWIPEWPKGTDCKSAATCFGGSNPPLPIIIYAGVAELADAQDLKFIHF